LLYFVRPTVKVVGVFVQAPLPLSLIVNGYRNNNPANVFFTRLEAYSTICKFEDSKHFSTGCKIWYFTISHSITVVCYLSSHYNLYWNYLDKIKIPHQSFLIIFFLIVNIVHQRILYSPLAHICLRCFSRSASTIILDLKLVAFSDAARRCFFTRVHSHHCRLIIKHTCFLWVP
jgi:hypothetical protein